MEGDLGVMGKCGCRTLVTRLKIEDGGEDGNLIVGEGIHLAKGKSLAVEAPGVCWKID
jgi:hypothetical protein